MEILKGVHAIEPDARAYSQSALLVEDRLLLIDGTADPSARVIFDCLRDIKRDPKDISTIFVTHTHPDHVSGLATLREKSEAKIVAHEIEADFISRKKTYPGPPGPQRHTAVPIDVLLKDGQRYEELVVIHLPGHTPGNISLLDPSRSLLLAGDSIRNEGGILPMEDAYNIDPRQHRASIKRLATFDFEAMIPSHGTAITTGASRRIRALAATL